MPRYIDANKNLKGARLSGAKAAVEKDLRMQKGCAAKFPRFYTVGSTLRSGTGAE
ncbi:MAG: hypothetical protein JRN67_07355 [Nitrososphaerota archaeon]|nr:hypothetical protein [Nitrososphaerota archaeon]